MFGHERGRTLEARRFWAEQVGIKETMMAAQDLDDDDEVFRRFLDLLPPEKCLEGLTPEQVVRALGPDQILRIMPEEILRALSKDYIEKLSEPTRTVVRERLGH